MSYPLLAMALQSLRVVKSRTGRILIVAFIGLVVLAVAAGAVESH
jgi:hypothetical protein